MRKYLVIQLARFGDLLQTKRLISTLCARPDSEVHLCLDASLAPLAGLVYPGVAVHPVTAHGTGLSHRAAARAILLENRKVFGELAGEGFDTVYNLNFSPLNFRLAALFDLDTVRGYRWRNGQELVDVWPSMAMRWSATRRIGINLVDFWAGYCPDMIPGRDVNPVAAPKGGGIGVVLAGRQSRRSLEPALLARYVKALARGRNAGQIVLLGGNSEERAGRAVLKELPSNLVDRTENLAGKTDWAGLVEVVGGLDALITPDTGTMHLAAHLGTPVLAFFLSSAWCFETGPYGAGHTVYQAVTECAPCLESAECHEGLRCKRPFADPGFERFLITGNPGHRPEGVLALTPAFDELGITYVDPEGRAPDQNRRAAMRGFLTDFLLHKGETSGENSRFLAEFLYRDRDFMAEYEVETSGHTL